MQDLLDEFFVFRLVLCEFGIFIIYEYFFFVAEMQEDVIYRFFQRFPEIRFLFIFSEKTAAEQLIAYFDKVFMLFVDFVDTKFKTAVPDDKVFCDVHC